MHLLRTKKRPWIPWRPGVPDRGPEREGAEERGHGERSRLQLRFKYAGAENMPILAVNVLVVNVLAVNRPFST